MKSLKSIIPHSFKIKIQSWINEHSNRSCEYKLTYVEKSRLQNLRVIVTGATGAIGNAICLRLACEGAIVGVGGRNEKKINDVIERIKTVNPNAILEPIKLDVLDQNNIDNAINSFVINMFSCGEVEPKLGNAIYIIGKHITVSIMKITQKTKGFICFLLQTNCKKTQ